MTEPNPFTPKQNDALEDRDLDRSRESKLSHGERQELDDRDDTRKVPPFTQDQKDELDRLAEKRDQLRPRKSVFSVGEQVELEETANLLSELTDKRASGLIDEAEKRAKGLDFNDRQRAELTRRFRKRWLPLIGYIILALGMVYSVQTARDAAFQHSNQNRKQATAIVKRVTYENCLGNNEFRGVLRGIILGGIPQTEKYVKEHTITQAQADRAIAAAKADAAQLHGRDCTALVALLK